MRYQVPVLARLCLLLMAQKSCYHLRLAAKNTISKRYISSVDDRISAQRPVNLLLPLTDVCANRCTRFCIYFPVAHYSKGACSVAATYKPLILVHRAQLPKELKCWCNVPKAQLGICGQEGNHYSRICWHTQITSHHDVAMKALV